jgi:hypothetical protein
MQKSRPPPTRTLLSVLASSGFNGVSEYLEARVDAPLLDKLHVLLAHRPKFDTSQLAQFIGRTPTLMTHDEAQVVFFYSSIHAFMSQFRGRLNIRHESGVKGEFYLFIYFLVPFKSALGTEPYVGLYMYVLCAKRSWSGL